MILKHPARIPHVMGKTVDDLVDDHAQRRGVIKERLYILVEACRS